MSNMILTESRDTTEEQVSDMGVSVVCPPETNLALHLKFSPIFTSNIIWHLICSYPGGMCSTSFPQTSKAGLTFLISLHIASHHCESPFSWSRHLASSTDLGIRISNLWVLSQYFDLTFDMIWFLFINVYGTHQAKSGSMAIFAATGYSAVCTGYDSLRSFSDTQFVLPSFHCARSSHPLVVSRLLHVPERVVMNAFLSLISRPFTKEYFNSSNRTCLLPS